MALSRLLNRAFFQNRRRGGYDFSEADLSERALVNFVYSSDGVPESVAGSAQAGEGFYGYTTPRGFDVGGRSYYVMTLFSAGIGVVPESAAPYRNEEGVFVYEVKEEGSEETQTMYMTQDECEAYKDEHPNAAITPEGWAGYMTDDTGRKYFDWSVDESLWNVNAFSLKSANVLPEVRVTGESETYQYTDVRAVAAVKSEILAGHGVSIGYYLDGTNSEDNKVSMYFDRNTWSHYTWESRGSNHRVCIMGWDDGYAASNFKNSEGVTPPGNGAWIVKQSSGAESENQDQQNNSAWGILDEYGKHTGYFYLSYYDQSIKGLMSFDFDVTSSDSSVYMDQYDFLPERMVVVNDSDEPVSSANIFTAQGDMALRTVSTETYKENTTVTYQVYLLDDEATTPTDPEHAKLVLTVDESYPYGGYYRTSLDANDWIAMRKGQRYAVVSTQKCDDDGKWYQGAITNMSYATHAKLNDGESWTGSTEGSDSQATAKTRWDDWTAVKQGVDDCVGGVWSVDNAPIKAISEKRNWASVDELASLESAIGVAKNVLESAVVSVDGTDVSTSATWMTQNEHDAFSTAIKSAEAELGGAGDDYRNVLTNTTPDSAEVNAAIASLASPAKAGTKADAEDKGNDGAGASGGKADNGKDASSSHGSSASSKMMAATGGAVLAVAASGVVAVAAALLAVFHRRARG